MAQRQNGGFSLGAIGVHHTATDNGTWDGPANEARLKNDAGATEFRRAFAWVDPSKDADTKSAYSFIHHEIAADGSVGPANLRACSAGIGVLNGGRLGPGASAPWSSDKAAIYRHLAAHLTDANLEAPPLRTAPTGDVERRVYEAELRVTPASEEDGPPKITGYAAVFDELSLPIGGMFQERLAPNAFSKALRGKPDVRALFNHDPNYVLGRTKAQTLQLSQDATGLAVEITPPDTQWARDLMTSMQRGDISQMSFGFRVGKDSWAPSEDGTLQVRTVLEVSELLDVSPVTFPAYPQTSVQARDDRRDGMDHGDMLEMLSGRAFDEHFIECLIERYGDILELTALAPPRAGDQKVLDLAGQTTSSVTAQIQSLRDFLAALTSGEPLALPTAEANSQPPWRPALLQRRLELLRLAR